MTSSRNSTRRARCRGRAGKTRNTVTVLMIPNTAPASVCEAHRAFGPLASSAAERRPLRRRRFGAGFSRVLRFGFAPNARTRRMMRLASHRDDRLDPGLLQASTYRRSNGPVRRRRRTRADVLLHHTSSASIGSTCCLSFGASSRPPPRTDSYPPPPPLAHSDVARGRRRFGVMRNSSSVRLI